MANKPSIIEKLLNIYFEKDILLHDTSVRIFDFLSKNKYKYYSVSEIRQILDTPDRHKIRPLTNIMLRLDLIEIDSMTRKYRYKDSENSQKLENVLKMMSVL